MIFFLVLRILEREVPTLMKLYEGAATAVTMEGNRSQKFTVSIRVHQGSAVTPLLFSIINEVTKDIREGVVGEFLYAGDLILLGYSWEDSNQCIINGNVH